MQKINSQLAASGYVFIPSFMPEMETVESFLNLGKITQLSNIEIKQTLIPTERQNSTINTYSGNYGLSEFPLHTDLAHWAIPPRYFALRCVIGAENVATNLLDAKDIISALGRNTLKRTLLQPRRYIEGRKSLLKLIDSTASGEEFFRWDTLFINPINDYGAKVFEEVKDFINNHKNIQLFLTQPGDTLIIDNWKMLHGRSLIDQKSLARKIERVYFDEVF
jgi:L-asparagine oxygenase